MTKKRADKSIPKEKVIKQPKAIAKPEVEPQPEVIADMAPEGPEELLRKKMQHYFFVHPITNRFYVTSDGTPFFEEQWAREHQKGVDPEKKVSTVNR